MSRKPIQRAPRPRLLDLFCGGGGAAMGYHRAGFDVYGVDIRPQRNYPFHMVEEDALTFLESGGWHEFDAIHASPPCQGFTQAQRLQGRQHRDLLTPVRPLLAATGLPWIIENVPGAPMRPDLILCGSMFGLRHDGMVMYRHRWFEAGNWLLPPFPPATCAHDGWSISVFGHSVLGRPLEGLTTYDHPNERVELGIAVGRKVMDIDWMNRGELSEAIPPAYTEWIGKRLLEHLELAA